MNKEEIKELFDKYGVRKPIEKNGQSECKICKEKHRYSLTWTSFLYEYEGHYYCQEDLLIVLLNKENKKLKEIIYKAIEHIKSHQLCYQSQYEEESCFDNHLLKILKGE